MDCNLQFVQHAALERSSADSAANVCAATRIRRKLKLCATEKGIQCVLSAVVHII